MDDYAGYDPFDSLNSKLFRATGLHKSELFRLAWLQFGKHSPVNCRGVFGVPKLRNPKGVGLFISGLMSDFARTGDNFYLTEGIKLGDWLLGQRADRGEWQHSCWGYHFDWQARAFFVPAGKPNIITTCYVARSLYDLGEASGEDRFKNAALDAAFFISKKLFCLNRGRRFYSYIPGESAFVHNASLWGAAWCAFVGSRIGDAALIAQSREVVRESIQDQLENGSWKYGLLPHHAFIDGFHTGYNLEALCLIRDSLNTCEFDGAVRLGYKFYTDNFFDGKFTAKYYADSAYPIDVHSFAQAIFTLLKVGGSGSDVEMCRSVVARWIDLLYRENLGRFIYQKTKLFDNSINYTRWTQAWAYCALAYYNLFFSGVGHE